MRHCNSFISFVRRARTSARGRSSGGCSGTAPWGTTLKRSQLWRSRDTCQESKSECSRWPDTPRFSDPPPNSAGRAIGVPRVGADDLDLNVPVWPARPERGPAPAQEALQSCAPISVLRTTTDALQSALVSARAAIHEACTAVLGAPRSQLRS